MEKKKGFKGALKSAAESLTEKSCVEIFSDNRGVVDGCRGVIEYGSGIIRFDTGSKITVFKGRGLTITEFERNRAEICGIFSSVEFE